GTSDGFGDEELCNAALLPAGRELRLQAYVNVNGNEHDDDGLVASLTVSPLKNCPAEYEKPPAPAAGITVMVSGARWGATPQAGVVARGHVFVPRATLP